MTVMGRRIRPRARKTPLAAVASPAVGDDVPLLDQTHINQLCAVLGPTRLDGLFDLLVKELADRPALIRSAVLAGDVNRARHESHSFKGATLSVGAIALGSAAARIEHAADLAAMIAALPALDRQAARTRVAIRILHPPYSSSPESA
jgi:HPt (histidine-containing phosphotransfer) domain-containing protein